MYGQRGKLPRAQPRSDPKSDVSTVDLVTQDYKSISKGFSLTGILLCGLLVNINLVQFPQSLLAVWGHEKNVFDDNEPRLNPVLSLQT